MNKHIIGKYISVLIICALFTAAALFFTPIIRTASAQDSDIALSYACSAPDYVYLNAPSALFDDGSGVYIADGAVLKKYSGKDVIFSKNLLSAPSAVAVYNGLIITIESGALCSYDGTNPVQTINGAYTDFCLYSGKIYAIADKLLSVIPLTLSGLDRAQIDNYVLSRSASAITVVSTGIYVISPSQSFANKDDIYLYSTSNGLLTRVYEQSDKILSFTCAAEEDTLYTLTLSDINAYRPYGGALKPYTSRAYADGQIIFCRDRVYALTSLNALESYDLSLNGFTRHFCAASAEDGYFNSPQSASMKNSTLLVSDTVNNRVAVYGETLSYIHHPFARPVAAVMDNGGNVYVAHDINIIDKFNAELQQTERYELNGIITDIRLDTAKNLYALCGGNIYVLSNGQSEFTKLWNGFADSFTFAFSSNRMFISSGMDIMRYNGTGFDTVLSANGQFLSFAADISDNLYLLYANRIEKYQKTEQGYGTAQSFYFENQTLSSRASFIISPAQNSYISYGDFIITDTYRHRILKTSGSELDVSIIDQSFTPPDIASDTSPNIAAEGLIRTALNDLEVYARPMESVPLFIIERGSFVITASYDISASDEYSFIVADDCVNDKLIAGYVYKDGLSQPLAYSAPPAHTGTVYNPNTPVYKFPTKNSPLLAGKESVDAGTSFNLMPFVSTYTDAFGASWYRVAANNGEGYVFLGNISVRDYSPEFVLPRYNAVVIESEGAIYAPLYKIVDGEYVKLTERLAVGTRVEVIGSFDTTVPYTQIKYYDSTLGTLTCYIPTKHLEYEGVNTVLIVSIILIVIVSILIVLFILKVTVLKKKRQFTYSNHNMPE